MCHNFTHKPYRYFTFSRWWEFLIQLRIIFSVKIIKSYLKNDKFAFENSQEVAGLLSHDHSDLNWGSIVLVINIDSLEGARCNLIACGMASLK